MDFGTSIWTCVTICINNLNYLTVYPINPFCISSQLVIKIYTKWIHCIIVTILYISSPPNIFTALHFMLIVVCFFCFFVWFLNFLSWINCNKFWYRYWLLSFRIDTRLWRTKWCCFNTIVNYNSWFNINFFIR